MTARQVDRAAERLDGLRQKRRSRLAVSAVAAVTAGVALWASHSSTLAISLGAGIVVMALLAFNDTCRRRELLARLALNPHAYVVPDVKSYGEDLVAPRGRERLAASLDRMLKHAGTIEWRLELHPPGQTMVALSLTDDVFLRSANWERW